MELTLLAVPGCPNVALLKSRLEQIESGLGSQIPVCEVHGEAEAAALGMHGSPTLLVDGADPFAPPGTATGTATGYACRIYRDEHGRPDGAPSLAQLQRVLRRT
ncbi:hypothetical protein [Streptomyces sp. MZ04]|uniref:hypothetical protein n=1 Tax=Streptomyces sp. MZ04 TaxID=2559236 RepID=UPI00107EDF60|nr:hypothetical protein [Streptomyces sp. MZ04]TGB14640.1 hypothetical protein E2651_05240 [Streptomyces sp. MZ04]